VSALESELVDSGRAVRDSWTWLESLDEWELRNSEGARWLREVGNGADHVLGLIDPGGALPRFDLQAYRVLTVRPVDGERTSDFGWRRHPILRRQKLHTGCDYDGNRGDPVRAAAPGVVVASRRWSSYGNVVIIDHGMGVETRYAHLSKLIAREGDFVAAGTYIGNVGRTGRATGSHLHFEVRQDDRPVDPELAFVGVVPAPATLEEAAARVANVRPGS
jgi:murein DD-endopeptidase MepM/ murein hydrolase activator NlpD